MLNSKALTDMLTRHEGKRNSLYRCPSGKLTIGIGHNIEDNGLSDDVILMILHEDVANAARDLYRIFPEFYKIGHGRRAALIDMMFCLGLPAFRTFRRMITAIQAEDWQKAADEALKSKWAHQVGDRATEIAHMIRNNTYMETPNDPT